MDQKIEKLISAAYQIKAFAYSPYSKFKVGASILTPKGNIYSGCNIESCSYGATLCAEGAAIANMICNGEQTIAEVLVTSSSNTPCYPCGICLQKIAEFSTEETLIHICVKQKVQASHKLNQLLPYGFNKHILA